MEQKFYCKHCKEGFSIDDEDKYLNYNCPICNNISPFATYAGLRLKIAGGTIKG